MLLVAGFIKSYEISEIELSEVQLSRSQRATLQREGLKLNPALTFPMNAGALTVYTRRGFQVPANRFLII